MFNLATGIHRDIEALRMSWNEDSRNRYLCWDGLGDRVGAESYETERNEGEKETFVLRGSRVPF